MDFSMCSSGGSRISHRGGVDPLGGHGPPMWVLFGKNVCKNQRIWSHRGGRAPGTPPRSANVFIIIPMFHNFSSGSWQISLKFSIRKYSIVTIADMTHLCLLCRLYKSFPVYDCTMIQVCHNKILSGVSRRWKRRMNKNWFGSLAVPI